MLSDVDSRDGDGLLETSAGEEQEVSNKELKTSMIVREFHMTMSSFITNLAENLIGNND